VQQSRKKRGAVTALSLISLAATVLLLAGARAPVRRGLSPAFDPVPSSAASAEQTSWGPAARRVSEDRGEPTGRQADVEVPEQLRHYSDRRRFLAIQVAEWREHGVATPHDYADLAGLIQAGELVEVPAATESHVLYGVGALADGEPFTHFDEKERESVALLDERELAEERARLGASVEQLRADLDALWREAGALGKRERTRRASLRRQAASAEKSLKAERERLEHLESFYAEPGRRRGLAAEREVISALAGDFAGRVYDLEDARARQALKVRMLAHLRPEALSVLSELADSYRAKFGRPLPVTSLVRPDEYQHRLSKSNANATRIETPPHSTGLAFDILYRYMTAEEQEHVMADIARLRDAGRVESLRENRDHFHVFAFADGRRPAEDLIRASLGHSAAPRAPKAGERPEPAEAKNAKASKTAAKRAARKETAKQERRGKSSAKKEGARKAARAGRKRR
jgi:hypothetical protein